MTEMIGYGEDALTLLALIKRKGKILGGRGRGAGNIEKIFYRPSFGRGRRCLGEPDAVIKTKSRLFFVESKWMESKEFNKRELVIREEQINRTFKIMDAILNKDKRAGKILKKNIEDFIKITKIKNKIKVIILFLIFSDVKMDRDNINVYVKTRDNKKISLNDYINMYINENMEKLRVDILAFFNEKEYFRVNIYNCRKDRIQNTNYYNLDI